MFNNRLKRGFMKTFIVCTSDYYGIKEFRKGFSDFEKAVDYATSIVLDRSNKYNEEYVKNTIRERHSDNITDLFVYTDFHDMDYDEYVGIEEVEVEC